MKSLHTITIGLLEAWVWTEYSGGNAALIDHGTAHLALATRGTPPATIQNLQRDWNPRRYWYPFTRPFDNTAPLEARLTVLCGRLKTASRFPHPNAIDARWDRRPHCQDCTRIAGQRGITPQFISQLIENDPWQKVPLDERNNTLDPVTNL